MKDNMIKKKYASQIVDKYYNMQFWIQIYYFKKMIELI